MKLLAIETSTDACSVGLFLDGHLLLDHRIAAQQHGTLVLPMVDELMQQAGLTPAALDGVVFGRGPGSFTGVRIGVAVTQGIALGADVGVVGISTLQSLAQGCHRMYADTHVAVSMDARMEEVYFGAFRVDADGLMQAVTDEQLLAPVAVALPADISACADEWLWAGSGTERYADLLQQQLGVPATRRRPVCWPHAEDLLTLALPVARTGGLLPPEAAMPVYLRDKVAQTTEERAGRG